MDLDTELQHVAMEAMGLVRTATEPSYVKILLRAAQLQRENERSVRVQETVQNPRGPGARKQDAISENPIPEHTIHWLDIAPSAVDEDKDEQPKEPKTTYLLCPGTSWAGDPDEYQQQAAVAAVAAGVTIMPWHWVDTVCGSDLCLEVKHMVFRKPKKLLYPPGVCVYCGEYADTQDHLLPVTYTGSAVRRQVLTVPACRQCNSFIGDAFAPSITERRAIAHSSLRRRRSRILQSFDYTDEELVDFGHAMKSAVLRAREEKEKMLRRLAYPGDDSYDLEFLALSGIDDPYAFGLLKTGEHARNRKR